MKHAENEQNIISHYSKHKEDNRLQTRHGTVEFKTCMHYLLEHLKTLPTGLNTKIADIGAGTGRYSIELARMGYDVTAVELVAKNLEILRCKHENVKTWQGNALDLNFLEDNLFDVVILFGPMYHLMKNSDKIKALNESKRILKKGGTIFISYLQNEYSLISYCFKENRMSKLIESGQVDKEFHIQPAPEELYSYVRIRDMDYFAKECGLTEKFKFAPDGPADYMRPVLNQMDEENFELFCNYVLQNSRRPELLGASSHLVQVLGN